MKQLGVLAVCWLMAVAIANREKRCAGCIDSVIAQGCVVTGDQLYVNGYFAQELSPEDMNEFDEYKSQLQSYKKMLKELPSNLKQSSFDSLPMPPKTPKFCNSNVTTQYVFDGCIVQDNKVYIGGNFARDLSPDEIVQMQNYVQKMNAYQEYLTSTVQQQVSSFFSGIGLEILPKDIESEASNESESSTTASTTMTPVAMPPAPGFCTSVL